MCRRTNLLISVFLVLGLAVPSAQAQWISSVVRTGNSTQPKPGIALDPLTERWHDLAGWHGSVCYNNRTHIYASVPTEVLGAQYVQVCNADKTTTDYTLTVTMSANATLYLFLDNRLGGAAGGQGVDPIIPPQMGWVTDLGFTDTGLDMGIDENADGSINNYFSVFCKQVNSGDAIGLGPQADGGARNMYAVAAMPIAASNPSPANGAMDVPTNVMLNWTPASGATSHDIYLGTDQTAVADATTASPGIYRGRQLGASYTPGTLADGTTYYWRIDELDGTTTYPGNIWSFTTQGQGEGHILFEYFWGTDATLESLLALPTFPDSPDQSELRTSFEGRINWRDNYGTHVRGYLYPPVTGNYTFWIASDDQSKLWLSSDEDPAHAVQIASVPGWTPSRDFDNIGGGTGGPQQMSSEITLKAGRRYYIEALQSEGTGSDNLAVAWQGPSIPTRAVISGTFLSPWIREIDLKAANPSPPDGATLVPIDAVLTWTPGVYADKHDVYFGVVFDDVVQASRVNPRGVLVSQNQMANTYDPILEYGQTYYWRIDEVSAPPDSTIFMGNVWSFTTTGIVAPPISIPTNTSVGSWDSLNRIYTLTQDVPQCIQIDADNLTLDGDGHKIVGPGSGNGIDLLGRTGVTVSNLRSSQFEFGVQLQGCNHCTVTGNTCNSNYGNGIYMVDSSDIQLLNNTCNFNGHGAENEFGIQLWGGTHCTISGNTCNGNVEGGIMIVGTTSSQLTDNTCNSNGSYGININHSDGNTLTGNHNEANVHFGIHLYYSNGNTLTGNKCNLSSNGDGVKLYGSGNNTLIDNTNNSNGGGGIVLDSSNDNSLTGNSNSSNALFGINLYNSTGNTLTSNTCRLNNQQGINLFGGSNSNNLTGNVSESNVWAGIRLDNSTGNTLTGNTNSNNNLGIQLINCSDNQIYNNNFIDNSTQARVDGGSGNIFNLNKPIGGNYWSDWTTPDADDDGFVDSPYIFPGGQDNLPLRCWDSDGIPIAVEDAAPNNGDGNSDGIPDSEQSNVASLPNCADGQYVTLVSSDGTSLSDVRALSTPPNPPEGAVFPVGFFEFAVSALVDGKATVTLWLPADVDTTNWTYLKYGPTPDPPPEDHLSDHWYTFIYPGEGLDTETGAEISEHSVTLHFVDGRRGDHDLTVDGVIADPGAPAMVDATPPTIQSISASPDVLWPVDHKMVKVAVTVDCDDNVDPSPVCKIVDVKCNEPVNGPGDGNTNPDWEITGDLTVKLRAERAGTDTDRTYTIHVQCTDASGNTTAGTVDVTVPHDQGKGNK